MVLTIFIAKTKALEQCIDNETCIPLPGCEVFINGRYYHVDRTLFDYDNGGIYVFTHQVSHE
jgi:hypothetical protein